MSDIEKLKSKFISANKREDLIFEGLMNRLDKLPEGKDALKKLADSGYDIYIDSIEDDVTRSFADAKILFINRDAPMDELVSSMIQEGNKAEEQMNRGTQLNLLSRFDVSLITTKGNEIRKAQNRFDSIVEGAYNMPGGKELLDKMTENNYQFCFAQMEGDKDGDFIDSFGLMYLNPEKDDKTLAQVLLRESERAVAYANRPRTKVLSEAFKSQNKGDDQAAFDRMLETAYKTPIGKEVIDKASELGYSYAYEDLSERHAKGLCNSANRQILLDPKFPIESQIVTLIHEMRHAVQDDLRLKNLNRMPRSCLNAADYVKYGRMIEADACACQSEFTYQLQDVWPEAAAYNMQRKNISGMMQAYMTEMDKSGDNKKAMESSFKAWYEDTHYQQSYQKDHCEDILNFADYGIKTRQDWDYFKESCSNKKLLSICQHEGQSYVDPSFLDTDMAKAMSQEWKDKIAGKMDTYSRVTGTKQDRSVENIVTFEELRAKKRFANSMVNDETPARAALFKEMAEELYKIPEGRQIILEKKDKNFYFEELADGQTTERLDVANMIVLDPRKSAKELAAAVCKDIRDAEKANASEGYIGTLIPTYENPPRQEIARLKEVTALVSKLPEGQEMVAEMSQMGYTFSFEPVMMPEKVVTKMQSKSMVLDADTDNKILASSMQDKVKDILDYKRLMSDLEKGLAGLKKQPSSSLHNTLVNKEKEINKQAEISKSGKEKNVQNKQISGTLLKQMMGGGRNSPY